MNRFIHQQHIELIEEKKKKEKFNFQVNAVIFNFLFITESWINKSSIFFHKNIKQHKLTY